MNAAQLGHSHPSPFSDKGSFAQTKSDCPEILLMEASFRFLLTLRGSMQKSADQIYIVTRLLFREFNRPLGPHVKSTHAGFHDLRRTSPYTI
jgi:hypothetical protein